MKTTRWMAGIVLAFCLGASTRAGEAPTAADEAKIQALVKDLGNEAFDKRQAAEKELYTFGLKAESALKAALNSPDPQVKATASKLLGKIKIAAIGAIDYMGVLPANAVLAGQLTNLGLSIEKAKKSAIGQLIASSPFDPLRQKLDAAMNGNPEAKKQVELWLARFKGQFAFAIWDLNMARPEGLGIAAVAEITDADPKAVLDDFLKQTQMMPAGVGPQLDVYRDVEILHGGIGMPDPTIALVGRHLVLGVNPASVKKMVDGLLTPGGLGVTPAYAKIKPALGAKPELIFAMDMEGYFKQVSAMMAAMGAPDQTEPLMKWMKSAGVQMKMIVFSSACTGDSYEDRYVAVMDGPLTGLGASGVPPPDAPPALNAMALVPANALLASVGYVNGEGMFKYALEYFAALQKMTSAMQPPAPPGAPPPPGAMPNFEQLFKDFEAKAGLKLAPLFDGVKGDVAYYASMPAGPGNVFEPPELGILLTCADADKAKALSEAVAKAINAFITPSPVKQLTTENRAFYQLDLAAIGVPLPPKVPYAPSWVADGNRLFISSSMPALRKQLANADAKTPGLLTQPEFVKALGALSAEERKGSVMYADLKGMLTLGATLGLPWLQGNVPDPDIKKALAALPPPKDLFKDIPPLLASAVVRDGRSETIMRSPLPPMLTGVILGIGAGIVLPQVRGGGAPADKPPGGF